MNTPVAGPELIEDLPIFPLSTVLFPDGLLPLRIFEQRYMDMAKVCLKQTKPFGVCLIREGREVGTPAMPEEIGCTAHILEWDMQQLGLLLVKTRGGRRFRILDSTVAGDGLRRARVELLPTAEDSSLPPGFAACAQLLKLVVAQHGEDIMAAPLRFDSSEWVGARLTEILPVPMAAKQRLLELEDPVQRVEILHKFLLQHDLAGKQDG